MKGPSVEPDRVRPATDRSCGKPRDGWWQRLVRWVGNRELSLLLLLFVLCATASGFLALLSAVLEGDTREFDRTVMLALRESSDPSNPIGPGWVEETGRDFTALGGIAVLSLVTLTVCGYLFLARKRHAALLVLVATLGALGLSTLLKDVIDRDRPDLVSHGTRVYTASFPSAHSMHAASVYMTLGALLARVQSRRRIKTFILLVAASTTCIVGVSRVYLGVHWPTDVVAGWSAGVGWATLCWLVARWLQRQGQVEGDPESTEPVAVGE